MNDNVRLRIAHLVSHPVQYYVPLYRALAKRPDIDLTVYYYSGESIREYFDVEFGRQVKWDVPLLGGYRHRVDPGTENRRVSQGFDLRPNWSILKELRRSRPDVIWANGYQFINTWLAAALGSVLGCPVFLRDEQNLLPQRSLLKRALKRAAMPLLYRHIWGLYIGENSRRFFLHYKTPSARLYPANYCVDNDFFRMRYSQLRPERPALRKAFGIDGPEPVILFSGKLIDKKKPQLLLEAFHRLRKTAKCHLLLVGEGGLRAELEAKIQADSIPDVHWAGFLNQSDLPRAYIAADIFVLPSAYAETWGLVVNEAMNFDLPIVVSDQVGCAADLVEEGGNGNIFPSGDVDRLASVLEQLVANPALRRTYGLRSGEIIARYSIENVASQIVAACQHAKGRGTGFPSYAANALSRQ